MAWGALGQARDAVVASLKERARRAEEDQEQRVQRARADERARLAWEMHDVLAHRLTIVATYAGALAYRPDAPPERLAQAAEIVRSGIQLALQELRDVVRFLRDDDATSVRLTPQPDLADLTALVEETRTSGTPVDLHCSVDVARRRADPSGADRLPSRARGIDERPQTRRRRPDPGRRDTRSWIDDRHRDQRCPCGAARSGDRRERWRFRADRAARARRARRRTAPPRSDAGPIPARSLDTVARVRRPIRVLLVDDDALVRSGLSMMLDGARNLEVVGEVGDGDEVGRAVDVHRPDVILMDVRMRRVDGITATRRVRARPDPPEVIVLTTFDTDEHILDALRAGASGFLLKDAAPAQIVEAIERVAAGESILSPTVTRWLMQRVAADADTARRAQETLAETHRARARRRSGRRARAQQRRHRRRVEYEHCNRESACLERPRQTARTEPHPPRPDRPRRRVVLSQAASRIMSDELGRSGAPASGQRRVRAPTRDRCGVASRPSIPEMDTPGRLGPIIRQTARTERSLTVFGSAGPSGRRVPQVARLAPDVPISAGSGQPTSVGHAELPRAR